MVLALRTTWGGTGSSVRAESFCTWLRAFFRQSTKISFSLARVMATYSRRISSESISFSISWARAILEMVG